MAIWTILLTTSTARRRDKIDGSLLSIHRGLSTSGKHHFTSDGVRYFSPLCQQCIAARADANGVVTLNAINADDESNPDLNDVNDLSFDLEAATKWLTNSDSIWQDVSTLLNIFTSPLISQWNLLAHF